MFCSIDKNYHKKMAKISKIDVYPYDTLITMLDYLLGTDKNGNLKTKSYKVQALADLFLAYVQENADGLDQDNIFTIIDLGETGLITQIQGQNIDEALVKTQINTLLQNTNLTITEKQLIILKLTVRINIVDAENNFISNVSQKRKYYFPLGKGYYIPLSSSVTANELELAYIEASAVITDGNVESNPNNVIFDLGDITGEDYLSYINTQVNAEYPTGYPLIESSKIYYFKWIDDGITYLYYFDEANSLNSYGNYGTSGDYVFQEGELVLFYSSNNATNPLDNLFVKKSFAAPVFSNVSGENALIPLDPNGYSEIRLINPGLVSIAGCDFSLIEAYVNPEYAYNGKPYIIRNHTGNPITVINQLPGELNPFKVIEVEDFVIPNNHAIYVNLDSNGFNVFFKSWNEVTELNWGSITGTLSEQTDLIAALAEKEPEFSKNTGFNKNFGAVADTVTEGNDARLSDARTPLAHTHAQSDVVGLVTDLANKLNKDISTLPVVSLPLVDTDKLIVNRAGVDYSVDKSELGGGGARKQTYTLTRDWGTTTLDRVYYINYANNTLEFRPGASLHTVSESLFGRNAGMFIAPYNCKIKKVILTSRNTGSFTGKLGVGSGKVATTVNDSFTNKIIHLDDAIVSAGYFINEYVFPIVSGATITAGDIISPSLFFSAQASATKNGVTIQIEIEEVI